jgi:hypothetical protein
MDAFAKSDDERDFYLDRVEGFLLYFDLDKGVGEIEDFSKELKENAARYSILPQMTFYELKKFMEGFVHEKVYDIDTKDKLLDIIQAKEARENFLEFIYDHLTELEKWQQYYTERSRIRIIEWLRAQQVQFVFEEDIEVQKSMMEKLKRHLFDAKVSKDVAQVREMLLAKAKTYYSNEALNPRPKRGRPPKQVVKAEVEPQVIVDMYTTVPPACRPFLYLPDISSAAGVTFSAKFDNEAQLLANLRGSSRVKVDTKLQALSERLESLRMLSSRLSSVEDLGLAQEQRLMQEVTRAVESTGEPPKIAQLAQGFLPGQQKKPTLAEKGQKKKSKLVTQLPSSTPLSKKGRK